MAPKRSRLRWGTTPPAQLSRQFFELLTDAGLVATPAKEVTKHASAGKGRRKARTRHPLSFLSLRHTMTSLLKATGAGEAVAMDMIGHDSAAISRHYTHTTDTAKASVVSALPDTTR